MRFVHVTDTHIGPTPHFVLHGQPALLTLEALVDRINHMPFKPDFVLHTGDVTDDYSDAAYTLARAALSKLRYPIYYVVGNHDRPAPMQRVLLDKTPNGDRYDYYVEIGGFGLAVFDTRGPKDPGGTLLPDQLAALRDLCRSDGPPLIIAIHHQPVKLDTTWLDEKWPNGLSMPLDCGDDFRAALAPARDRIRGVFFGHVHSGFQVVQDGILYCAGQSALLQFGSWPGAAEPIPLWDERPGFNVVTVTDGHTLVRQCTFARP